MRNLVIAAVLAVAGMGSGVAVAAPEKVIIDTDFGTSVDDGQTLIMAAHLMQEGKIDLLGVTVVTGNNWLKQEVAEALRAVERMGIAQRVGVYAGAAMPLVHDPKRFAYEKPLYGVGEGFFGAFDSVPPSDKDIIAPFDGFAANTQVRPEHAVDYLVETIKQNPHDVTILAIGPLTNIALAIRKNPEIVPLIKRIVYMAGAVEVPGNTTPAAELNVWIDPEAARIVFREPLDHTLIPLDVTNVTQLNKVEFDTIVANADPSIATLFRGSFMAQGFLENPTSTASIFDTLALAYLVDPSFATKTIDRYIDVDTSYGPGYGRTLGYWGEQPTDLLQRMTVVKTFDTPRFLDFYIDLMTRPIPVGSYK
jgi:inosine-uridine nucleoside N-ribohydrolase